MLTVAVLLLLLLLLLLVISYSASASASASAYASNAILYIKTYLNFTKGSYNSLVDRFVLKINKFAPFPDFPRFIVGKEIKSLSLSEQK
jgi:hypothetical protein